MVMLTAWSIDAKADHTLALDLSGASTNNVTYSTETNVATFTTSWGGVYWSATDAMRSFTTATLVVDAENTDMDIYITVRYTKVGESSTTDVNTVISQGSTTASVEIPAEGTLNSIRVANRGKAGNVKLVSVTLSGLRDTYELSLTTLGAGSNTATYNKDTKTISFAGDGSNQYRGWSIDNSYLNDYKTVVVEFAETLSFDVEFKMNYKNGSNVSKSVSKTVKQYNKRASLSIPATDINSITNIIFKTTDSTPHTLTIKKAYLTTDKLAYFDIAAATNTWSGTKSSYDASTQTITWTDVTRHGWWIGSADYNSYKSVVVEFVPAPVAMTGYLSYYATEADYNADPKVVTYTDVHIPAGSTMVALPIPTTIYRMTAVMLAPVSACSLKLTDAYATDKEYENSKTITLSTTETVCGDSWTSGYLLLTKEQLALAQAGDQIAVNVTAISSTDATPVVALQTGSFGNFTPAVSNFLLSGKTAPVTATFTLTEAMLATINGETENVNSGLVVKGSGFTFNKVSLIHNIYKIKGQPATNLWSGEEVITWNAPSNYVTLPASSFALAKKDMKLRMSFKDLKLSAQGRISSSAWGAIPDADSYETLKSNWGNYYEFTITDDMLAELQANGMHVTGVGYTLTSVDLIDSDCEYDIETSFDTADIIAWETSDGTPNLTVTITNNEVYEITVPINIALMTDMFTDFNTYSANVTLAAGETKVTDVNFSDLTAGFYRMAANVAGNKLCTYYIGYNPTAIVSPNDAQNDFWAFWDEAKAELAAISILDGENTYVTKLDAYSTGARDIYKIKIQGAPDKNSKNPDTPVYIYGYFAVPNAAGDETYPCLINFHGTDSGTGTPSIPGTNANTGWCELNISMPGQYLSRVEEDNTQYIPDGASKPDFYAYGLGDNLKHYYRMAYLDCVRAVDFVCSQAKVNQDYIFAAGGSQGGCLTYVCAGLNAGRIRGIAPSITGHADFPHTMEIVGWPTNVFNNWINAKVADGTYADYATGKAALLAHLSYFDTKNFASRIICPVITNFSLQDDTDGPHLNISPYNLLVNVAAADKRYSINQFKGHSAKDGWSTEYMTFFGNYINTPLSSETSTYTMSAAKYGTYYSSNPTMLPSGVQAATIDGVEDNTLSINWRYNGSGGNNVIPGETAVLLKSENGDYTLREVTGNTTLAPTPNLLHGHDSEGTTTGDGKHYKLSYNNSGENLGWYYGADNGAAFTIGAHKAWLVISNSLARNLSFFSLDGEGGGTTDISEASLLNNNEEIKNNNIFDLQGRKVTQPTKGLYIVNGKKLIIK